MRTFFSLRARIAQFIPCTCMAQGVHNLCEIVSSLVMSLLNVPSSHFSPIFSSPTCSLTRPSASSTPLTGIRRHLPVPLRRGVECLAIWLIRLQTQGGALPLAGCVKLEIVPLSVVVDGNTDSDVFESVDAFDLFIQSNNHSGL